MRKFQYLNKLLCEKTRNKRTKPYFTVGNIVVNKVVVQSLHLRATITTRVAWEHVDIYVAEPSFPAAGN